MSDSKCDGGHVGCRPGDYVDEHVMTPMYICDDDADGSIVPHIFTVKGTSILSVHDLLADVDRVLAHVKDFPIA